MICYALKFVMIKTSVVAADFGALDGRVHRNRFPDELRL